MVSAAVGGVRDRRGLSDDGAWADVDVEIAGQGLVAGKVGCGFGAACGERGGGRDPRG